MNVTELARRLRVPVGELRYKLPLIGFDIGKKAIKVDPNTARKILNNWKTLNEKYEKERLQKMQSEAEGGTLEGENIPKKKVSIPSVITVREFAEKIETPVSHIIKQLMKNGIFASLNETIDFDTANIISDDFNVEIVEDEDTDVSALTDDDDKLEELLKEKNSNNLKSRPPVIVIMGHVDHGKTKLLDAIKKTDVVAGEHGGITQHIGAYQIIYKDQKVTFIDTPGHEAFTAMRSRGAKVADIAVLIVAADDGVKPQTVEALKIIEKSKLPIVVAINKIDKPNANIDNVKQELSKHNLLPEDWGGKTICVNISAMTGEGIDELLDMLLLVNEVEKDNILANPDRLACGTVVESHLDKGEGPVATVMVQAGTLKKNDSLIINNSFYGKVKIMRTWRNVIVDEAGPSTPVRLIGFKVLPKVGDIVQVHDGKKGLKRKIKARDLVKKEKVVTIVMGSKEENENDKVKSVNLILKADVLGSLEAVEESLEKMDHDEVKVKIVSKGLGPVTESDVLRAESTNAYIYAFNVKIPSAVESLSKDKKVDIDYCTVIYKLLDDVFQKMEKLLDPEITITPLGKLNVLAVFRTTKEKTILGGKVIDGIIKEKSKFKVIRDEVEVGTGEMTSLQTNKISVKEIEFGKECGMSVIYKDKIKEGDILDFYFEEKKKKKLKF